MIYVILVEPPAKKSKVEKNEILKKDNAAKPKKNINISEQISRCKVCRQDLDDPELRMFQGPPNNALEEEVALFDPKLSLFNGTEECVSYEDSRPSHKLTHFRLIIYNFKYL